MALRFDAVLGEGDRPFGVHDERGTDDPLNELPVVHLLAVGAIGRHDLAVRVRGQWEVEIVLVGELLQ